MQDGLRGLLGLTRAEEQAHLVALGAFSVGPVKQVEVEDMDYTYGDASLICNDAITLSSNRASEKLAVSFAMAQSSKLDVFEERVEEAIRETKHVPQNPGHGLDPVLAERYLQAHRTVIYRGKREDHRVANVELHYVS